MQLPLLLARWKQVLLGAMFQYVHGMSTQLAHRMHRPQEEPLGDLGFTYLPVGWSAFVWWLGSDPMSAMILILGFWCVCVGVGVRKGMDKRNDILVVVYTIYTVVIFTFCYHEEEILHSSNLCQDSGRPKLCVAWVVNAVESDCIGFEGILCLFFK